MKRRLFLIAHSVKAQFNTFAEALVQAWKIIKLAYKMQKANVEFAYKKVDGSLRKAVGTLNVDYKSTGDKPTNFGVFTYFDVEADGWRSAKCELLIF